MIKKILKTVIIVLLILIGLFILFVIGSGGFIYDFGQLENSLLEYYSNDESYGTFTGEIIDIQGVTCFEIKMLDTTEKWPVGTEIEFQVFFDDNWTKEEIVDEFKIGDKIIFKAATKAFYNGQIIPIVYIEKEGEVCLEFNDGKNSLIEWVKNQKWTVLG